MKRSTLASTGRVLREACHGSIVIFVDATSLRRNLTFLGIFFGVLVSKAPIEVQTLPILCGTKVLMVVTFLFFFLLN